MDSTIFQGPQTLTGNILFVDAVNGNDATGAVGNANRPYLTLGAAKTAASSGQLVWVRPGSYTVTDSILKNGVNWYFDEGTSVSKSDVSGAVGIIDDKGAPITSIIGGYGVFSMTFLTATAQGTVGSQNTASNITVGCRSVSATQTDPAATGLACAIYNDGGTIRVSAIESISAIDTAIDFAITIYWQQGLTIIEAQSIWSTNNVVNWIRDGSTADNMYITCQEMYSTGASNGLPGIIYSTSGANTVASLWITADTIKANDGSGNCALYVESSVSRLYVTATKIFGDVRVKSGLVYVTATKQEALSNVTGGVTALFVTNTLGTLRWNVQQHDPKSFTGIAFLIAGGTFISNEIEYTAGSGSEGLSISSGTARLQTPYLSTSANTAGFPITKSGGVLILMAATLVSNGTQASINAGTAQNVVAMSSWANNAVNGNVTVTTTGGISINSNVA